MDDGGYHAQRDIYPGSSSRVAAWSSARSVNGAFPAMHASSPPDPTSPRHPLSWPHDPARASLPPDPTTSTFQNIETQRITHYTTAAYIHATSPVQEPAGQRCTSDGAGVSPAAPSHAEHRDLRVAIPRGMSAEWTFAGDSRALLSDNATKRLPFRPSGGHAAATASALPPQNSAARPSAGRASRDGPDQSRSPPRKQRGGIACSKGGTTTGRQRRMPDSRLNPGQSPQFIPLEEGFRIHRFKFFVVGRVFRMMANSPGRNENNDNSSAWTYNSYGQAIFTKSRRYVVVKSAGRSCLAVPITTYAGRGVAKPQVKKSDHCIAYSGAQAPTTTSRELPRPGEVGMQPLPVKIDPDERGTRMDPMSRIDFASPVTVDFYNEVKNFGIVNPNFLHALVSQFQNVMDPSRVQRITAALAPMPAPLQSSSTKDMRAYSALINDGWTPEEACAYLNELVTVRREIKPIPEESYSDTASDSSS